MARPDRSRQRLVATAARLLRRQGYAATGLQQVLAESGASSGSMYHHFPGGKEQLAVAAVQASTGAVTEELDRLLAATDTLTAVGEWLDAHIAELATDGRDGCPVAPVALEAVHASHELRVAAATAFDTWVARISQSLRRDGQPTREADTNARLLVSAVEGALILDRTSGRTTALADLRRHLPRLLGLDGARSAGQGPGSGVRSHSAATPAQNSIAEPS